MKRVIDADKFKKSLEPLMREVGGRPEGFAVLNVVLNMLDQHAVNDDLDEMVREIYPKLEGDGINIAHLGGDSFDAVDNGLGRPIVGVGATVIDAVRELRGKLVVK